MLILVINSGSSSIKYQLFEVEKEKEKFISKGIIERIGQGRSKIKTHKQGIKAILDAVCCRKIDAVGHRVVHGGEEFKRPALITPGVIKSIEKYSGLAPLHNPPALAGIRACKELLPDTPQAAVFDTAFHADMPQHAYLYALPYELYRKHKIRRYGFHGTSHHYVAAKSSGVLGKPWGRLKLITCHLGNGCSIAAIKNGRCIDTSMGFTPLEGLVMGTRCGDIDPAIVFYLMDKEGYTAKEIDTLLNKKSGLLGISGCNDMRDLLAEVKAGNKRAETALEIFLYRIKKYIGAYMAALNGADAVIFTAGIGENNPFIKDRIIKELSSLIKGCNTKVIVLPTNEELMIANQTYHLVKR